MRSTIWHWTKEDNIALDQPNYGLVEILNL